MNRLTYQAGRQAGRKEVVDVIEAHTRIYTQIDQHPILTDCLHVPKDYWKDKKKEWGIE